NSVPATMIVRARADAPGSLSFILPLTLDVCERLRKHSGECRDHASEYSTFVAGAIYQLDWSALRMGVLPRRFGEPAKGVADPLVKIVPRPFHPIALPTGVGSVETFRQWHIEQEREVGYEARGRQRVRRANLVLRQSAPDDLVRVGRKKE